jgi:NarL family two-component system response regulator LiaR
MVADQQPMIVVGMGELAEKNCAQLRGQADFVVLLYSGGGRQLIPFCRNLAPCVLVIDEHISAMLGIDRHANVPGREVRILVISDAIDDNSIYDLVLRHGVSGVGPSGLTGAALAKILRSIMRGELWVPRRILTKLVRDLLPKDSSKQLTPREEQILQLLGAGRNNREIAETLSISRETVRWHLRSLYAKLGTRNVRKGVSSGSQRLPKGAEGSKIVN